MLGKAVKILSAPTVIGVPVAGGLAYDIHKKAADRANTLSEHAENERLAQIGMNISNDNTSSAMGKFFQDVYFDKRSKTKVFKFVNNVKSYFCGIGTSIKDYFGAIMVTAATILGRKNIIGKIGAAGLLLMGAKYTYSHILDLGRKKTID